MKYFLFLCILYFLPIISHQQLVVLKQSGSMSSHEDPQTSPDSLGTDNDDVGAEEETTEVNSADDETIDIKTEDDEKDEITSAAEESSPDEEAKEEEDEVKPGIKETDSEEPGTVVTEDEEANENNDAAHPPESARVFILQVPSNTTGFEKRKIDGDEKLAHWKRFVSEIAASSPGQISGLYPRNSQPPRYKNLARRFVPHYLYSDKPKNAEAAPENKEIIPIQAPLEVVTKVLKLSVLEEAAKPVEKVPVEVLRSGDYWNAVWVEKVDPKSPLRMSSQHVLGTIKAKIKPGSEFYDLVSSMSKVSPRLLYVINDRRR